jgi:hypothetical protein
MTYLTRQPEDMKNGQSSRSFSLRDWFVFAAFRLVGQRLWDKTYTLLSESRRFLGSLRIQLAKDRASVSLGPAFELDPQSQQRNKRTLVRKRGIENLLAIQPWAAHQTFEIFLMGFDVGEQWALGTLDSKPHPAQYGPKSTSESN